MFHVAETVSVLNPAFVSGRGGEGTSVLGTSGRGGVGTLVLGTSGAVRSGSGATKLGIAFLRKASG